MGRLGPLNSLAFGRSPFQPPELDENGDFVLGLHARDSDNKDFYVQQFDERGHPKNDASKATIRAMQHAQNAVLETVGVVVRREEASKSAWQRQSKKHRMEDIINENSHGVVMREVGPFFLQSSMWWIISLRRRMQTFRSYLGQPLLSMVRSEVHVMGIASFLVDGLLPAIASYVLNILLMGMQSRRLEIAFEITLRGTAYSWRPFTSFTAGLVIPLIVFPAKAFAVLQSLHLIPSTFHLSSLSFVPFTAASPIQIPPLPHRWSFGTGLALASSVICHPFVVSTISDMTKSYIHNAMYRIILLTLAPRPDHPDNLTIKAARQKDGDSLSLPGIGPENNAERLSRARTNDFWTEIGRELGFLAGRIKSLKKFAAWLKPSPDNANSENKGASAQVRARSEALQRQMVRADIDNLRENVTERLQVQRQAHAWALQEFGIPAGLDGECDEFLLPAYEIFESDSTATPEPVELSEAGAQADYPHEPPRLHHFTPNNIHDRQEREGEGRIMAELTSYDLVEPSSLFDIRDHPSHTVGNAHSEALRDAFGSFRVASQESVSNEATQLPPEDTHPSRVSVLSDSSQAQTHSPGESVVPPGEPSSATPAPEASSPFPTPSDLEDRLPEAPDSPLDHSATPPAISRNRALDNASLTGSPIMTPSIPYSTSHTSRSSEYIPRRRRPDAIWRPRSQHRDSAPFPDSNSPDSEDDDDDNDDNDDNGAAHNSTPVRRHRVTMLSVFPAEMFAECLAGLITSAVTLPLDTLYVRSLVRGFLGGGAGLGVRGDVYGLGEWFGGGGLGWGGRLRYAGLLALMLGVQGCVSSLSWALVTRLAIATGRQSGWGQL